jgi:hypothetical protein
MPETASEDLKYLDKAGELLENSSEEINDPRLALIAKASAKILRNELCQRAISAAFRKWLEEEKQKEEGASGDGPEESPAAQMG